MFHTFILNFPSSFLFVPPLEPLLVYIFLFAPFLNKIFWWQYIAATQRQEKYCNKATDVLFKIDTYSNLNSFGNMYLDNIVRGVNPSKIIVE